MKILSTWLAIFREIHWCPVRSPYKGQRFGTYMIYLMLAYTRCWKTVALSIIWDATTLTWCHCNVFDMACSPNSVRSRESRCRHQLNTFFVSLTLCEGNPPVTDGFPSPMPVTRSFNILFDLCLNKRLSKQSRHSDLRRHSAHHDVTVMIKKCHNRLLQGRRRGSTAVTP